MPARLRDSLVLVVQGVRRCGKSTLLTHLVQRYRLNPKHCAFLNFEDPRLERGDRLRQQYFSDIVEHDIRERVGARSVVPVKQVGQMEFESMGAELSLRRIAGSAGIDVETVASYLKACQAAYVLFSVPYFAFSERKRAARNKKYYPIDTGLKRMAVTKAGADRGKLLECAVYLELRRHGLPVSLARER